MRGLFIFVLETLFPESCINCGCTIPPGSLQVPSVIPAGWPDFTLDFFEADIYRELFGSIRVPARIMCPRCWIGISPGFTDDLLGSTGSDEGEFCDRSDDLKCCSFADLTTGRVPLVTPFFTDEILLELIHFLKFSGGRAAVEPLSWWMAKALEAHFTTTVSGWPASPILVPVPLHRSRERRRGYNQAALLAARVASRLGLATVGSPLVRDRKTSPQSALDRPMRADNVYRAFRLTGAELIANKDIILIDDLVTTGATALSCISALLEGGPSTVTVLAAGRAGAARYRV